MIEVINKYGLHARMVREDDAAFILSLRTDPKLSRFIHPTENDEEKQRAYLQGYKERELAGKDYYFIFFLQKDRGSTHIQCAGKDVHFWKLVIQRRTAVLGVNRRSNYCEGVCI